MPYNPHELAQEAKTAIDRCDYPLAIGYLRLACELDISMGADAVRAAGHAAWAQHTANVPLIRMPMRDDVSHAPTTCSECGQLVRWHHEYVDVSTTPGMVDPMPGLSYWIHVDQEIDTHRARVEQPA